MKRQKYFTQSLYHSVQHVTYVLLNSLMKQNKKPTETCRNYISTRHHRIETETVTQTTKLDKCSAITTAFCSEFRRSWDISSLVGPICTGHCGKIRTNGRVV